MVDDFVEVGLVGTTGREGVTSMFRGLGWMGASSALYDGGLDVYMATAGEAMVEALNKTRQTWSWNRRASNTFRTRLVYCEDEGLKRDNQGIVRFVDFVYFNPDGELNESVR